MDHDHDVFDLGSLALTGGMTVPDAKLAYKTYGSLNADKSNAIVYPTWYSGRHWDNEWLIGEGRAPRPGPVLHHRAEHARQRAVLLAEQHPRRRSTGRGSPASRCRTTWPSQHRLVTEKFGIERLALVLGWSMGAGQTYQWAVSHPEMVPRMLPFCGSARTSRHNKVFLEGVKGASPRRRLPGGWYTEPPTRGLRAAARVYAGWGFSQAFYWDEVYREMGYASLEDFLVGFWEGFFLDDRDANNLLCMLRTWQTGDVGTTPGFDGDTAAALASITARAIVMPAEKDLYFPPEDEEWEVSHMRNAELRVIPGVWGHFAGGGENPTDVDFIDAAVKELLSD